ncbi:Cyclin-B1-1 [Hibiscus syriacus]|uniref:Cyclin-B1-1 n=1 Tax=Hibiscus syriacus TaxID=106335 RepID=A0A6A2ZPW7_HIBSY|nr:Cyclin-B1-1 [Hibiscus syriacus]
MQKQKEGIEEFLKTLAILSMNEQHKKPITEGVVVVAQAVRGPQRKVVDKPKPEDVIVISSDDKTEKSKHVSKGQGSSRKQAVCEFMNKLNVSIEDIDGVDGGNELAGTEYVDDIYKFYKRTEVIIFHFFLIIGNELAGTEYVDDIYKFYKRTENEGRARDYMDLQPDINVKMRSILVDWLIEVHRKFELMPETLYLTMNILDRFLSMKVVQRKELQLVGISAMLIACKYEEIWAPEVRDFVFISDNAYAREQVLVMEKAILNKFIKASIPSDDKVENLAFYLAELGLMQYPTAVIYCPSMLAAAAVYAARCTLGKRPLWSETLKHHTGYSENHLMNGAKLLVKFHSTAADSKLKALYRKFSSPESDAVALLAPAKSLLPMPMHHG